MFHGRYFQCSKVARAVVTCPRPKASLMRDLEECELKGLESLISPIVTRLGEGSDARRTSSTSK
jgi:hypothetical protein